MLTKIKKDLKNVTWFGWVTLAVAVVALWLALPHGPKHGHGGHKTTPIAEVVK